MFAILLLAATVLAAEPPKSPIGSVCLWKIANLSPDQAKRLAEMKKKAGCPEVKQ